MSVITERHTFGWAQEERLLPFFNKYLDDDLKRTTDRFAHQDCISERFLVEAKSRPATRWDRFNRRQVPVNSKSYPEGWLMPYCKTQNLPDNKRLFFFYYYEGDDTLWVCPYDKQKFSELNAYYPPFNPNQLHILIPVEWWSQVDCYKEEQKCE